MDNQFCTREYFWQVEIGRQWLLYHFVYWLSSPFQSDPISCCLSSRHLRKRKAKYTVIRYSNNRTECLFTKSCDSEKKKERQSGKGKKYKEERLGKGIDSLRWDFSSYFVWCTSKKRIVFNPFTGVKPGIILKFIFWSFQVRLQSLAL